MKLYVSLILLCLGAEPSFAQNPPKEMDLRQLWNELRLNNPQLTALRENYLSAKATVPQIAAPANPQLGLV